MLTTFPATTFSTHCLTNLRNLDGCVICYRSCAASSLYNDRKRRSCLSAYNVFDVVVKFGFAVTTNACESPAQQFTHTQVLLKHSDQANTATMPGRTESPSAQLGQLLLRGWTMLAEACEDCQVCTVVLQWREQQDFGGVASSTTINCHIEQSIPNAAATRPYVRHGLPCAACFAGWLSCCAPPHSVARCISSTVQP
jgi:hypothetical protein